MRTRKTALAIAIAIAAAAGAVHAEDLTALSLDQLLNVEVVTASKFAQKLSEAPSSVSIVTADDIRTFGYRTLADVLRSMRGLSVSYDRNYSYLGTRGSGRPGDFNARLLVLVDGQRLNDAVYSQGSIGQEFPIDIDLIERVEYVPGPGSAIYGSNAFFGVLNIITRKGKSFDGAEASVAVASHGTQQGRLTYGRRFDNGADLLVSGSGLHGAGADLYFPEYDDHDPAGSHGVAHGLDYERAQRFFARLSIDDLSLETFFGNRVKGVPTASYGQQFDDPRSHSIDRYFSASATYQHALSPTLDLFAQFNLSQYFYAADYALTSGPEGLNRDTVHSTVLGTELRFLSRAFASHKLIYGLETQNAPRRAQSNFNDTPYQSLLDSDQAKRGYALYVQDEYRFAENWILSAGVRRDHDNEVGNVVSPRLGLIAKLTPDLTAKLLYGTAFRSPNAYEEYYITAEGGYKSVGKLAPEHLRTYELVTEYFPRPDLKTTVSLYRYRLEDLITLATDPADNLLYYTNLSSATARGIEIEAESLGRDGSRLKGSLSLQTARNDATGEQLTNAPRALAKFNYSRPVLGRGARAALEVQYTARRSTVAGSEVGSAAVVNATLSHVMLTPSIELSGSIYNLLGKNYSDPPGDEHFDNSLPPRLLQGIRQDGRVLRLALNYRF